MKKTEQREEKTPKKKKTHRLYAFVVLLLAAAILALGILILFYVQEIEVSRNEYSTDQEIVEISLIENIQREDLNPIEEAQAYKRLLTEFQLKQDEVAE